MVGECGFRVRILGVISCEALEHSRFLCNIGYNSCCKGETILKFVPEQLFRTVPEIVSEQVFWGKKGKYKLLNHFKVNKL